MIKIENEQNKRRVGILSFNPSGAICLEVNKALYILRAKLNS